MTNKYKISDMAKDFNIKSKDLLAIITEATGSEKKSGAVLVEDEIGLVFNLCGKGILFYAFDAIQTSAFGFIYFRGGNDLAIGGL